MQMLPVVWPAKHVNDTECHAVFIKVISRHYITLHYSSYLMNADYTEPQGKA